MAKRLYLTKLREENDSDLLHSIRSGKSRPVKDDDEVKVSCVFRGR